jgi:hypothetical protein
MSKDILKKKHWGEKHLGKNFCGPKDIYKESTYQKNGHLS